MWRTTFLLSAVAVVGAGQTVVFAIVPASSRAIGLTEVQSSLIFSASAVASLMTNQLWGRASDTIGRLPIVVLGLLAYGVLLAILAGILQVGSEGRFAAYILAALLVCRGFHGALTTGVLPATQAHLADRSTSTERVGRMASATMAFGLGSLIGPVTVALLAPFGPLSPLWCFSAVAIALAIALCLLFNRSMKLAPTHRESRGSLKFTPVLVLCLALSGLFQIVFIGTMQIMGFYLQDRFHIPTEKAVSFASYAFLIIALTMIAGQALLVRFKTDKARALVVAGMLAGSTAYLLATTDSGPIAAAATPVLIGVSLALAMPSISAIASVAAGPQAYGAAMGAIGATQALGFLLGPVLASYLYSANRSLPLYVDAAMLGSCAILALRLPARVR